MIKIHDSVLTVYQNGKNLVPSLRLALAELYILYYRNITIWRDTTSGAMRLMPNQLTMWERALGKVAAYIKRKLVMNSERQFRETH